MCVFTDWVSLTLASWAILSTLFVPVTRPYTQRIMIPPWWCNVFNTRSHQRLYWVGIRARKSKFYNFARIRWQPWYLLCCHQSIINSIARRIIKLRLRLIVCHVCFFFSFCTCYVLMHQVLKSTEFEMNKMRWKEKQKSNQLFLTFSEFKPDKLTAATSWVLWNLS